MHSAVERNALFVTKTPCNMYISLPSPSHSTKNINIKQVPENSYLVKMAF